MKSVPIVVGQAGGKLTAELSDFDARNGFGAVVGSLAVNSARSDLHSLPLDSALIGGAEVSGHGVGGELQEIYDLPVYGLGILPGRDAWLRRRERQRRHERDPPGGSLGDEPRDDERGTWPPGRRRPSRRHPA